MNRIICLFSFIAFAASSSALEPVEVRVRDTLAGPRIFVDGKAVSPRFYFGSPQNLTILSWPRRTELIIPFVAEADSDFGAVELRVSGKDPPVWFSSAKIVDVTEGATKELTDSKENNTRLFKCENLKFKKSHSYRFHVFHRAARDRVVLDHEISYTLEDGIKKTLPLPYGDTLGDTVRMAGNTDLIS